MTSTETTIARLTAEASPYRDALARLVAAGRGNTPAGRKVAQAVRLYDQKVAALRPADRTPGWVARARRANLPAKETA